MVEKTEGGKMIKSVCMLLLTLLISSVSFGTDWYLCRDLGPTDNEEREFRCTVAPDVEFDFKVVSGWSRYGYLYVEVEGGNTHLERVSLNARIKCNGTWTGLEQFTVWDLRKGESQEVSTGADCDRTDDNERIYFTDYVIDAPDHYACDGCDE